MREQDFIPKQFSSNVEKGEVTWKSPSNIALVKYWGKKANQIPANPSVSFTLKNCKTTTKMEFQKKPEPSATFDFELYFEGKKKEDFKPKIQQFFQRIEQYAPFLKDYKLNIYTENSFPHSSGIASSASGMSALALCVMSLEKELNTDVTNEEFFYKKASFLARLGSGSACRSLEGELIEWGKHQNIPESSDLFGIKYPFEIDEVFKSFQDTILLVDKGQKQVSSSVGHNLMHGHPFGEERFAQAHSNLDKLKQVFASGNLEEFISIVESEALTLHAMMMSSNPYFILMKPNTLEIINKIWEFREDTKIPICFTLDAGANVHLLYPEIHKEKVLEFIKNELVAYCEKGQYICDQVGKGAEKLN
ncbi:diphosphomevalonate decarboxylase [Salegentibacter salarius]|uniref:diphosphomevalonate decarboxylase n=1 Tax=Salegentibacter salarius TaxID=435906 RepID=A0A2N0TYQ4_9FLAO|nr:diphosphomevalonate decarboxylase [Salegentibacter salarius]OEY72979.1 diphosphomevalonate decarboxylase [Salegentibacter salarius]PKD19877.1 diphosphomevalonate decarboxylase [Salegentibacter salarius]SLJ87150.1 diphosphomevalonate decarboxylase [Salegentibacter salarius]